MLSTIAIGSDHAGFHLKAKIIEVLNNQGIKTIDKGCYSEESVDYPDIAHGVVDEIHTKKASRGIVICGSGNGINMSANKHAFIRSALCWEPEIASLAVEHNKLLYLVNLKEVVMNAVSVKLVRVRFIVYHTIKNKIQIL
jgi:ribose 5-phosphate isomerase B